MGMNNSFCACEGSATKMLYWNTYVTCLTSITNYIIILLI